ncbi:peptidoglycan domain protein [Campylobacter sp. VBCF_06 NA8]|uniref:putative peptidoglycan-binding domain-containing protein n=1 Tax=Campylobacter sp. VBCF_06 NA8 TaxID=2983822 RepID=UPI0022E9CEB7|nr:putative peptidoglycan-binding domain-containing protein [Campylobacter sp. VBCF_06 NA8]MDA3046688.1 peptidoglycan domain protein [Campylobacter sp. VBCF_06 NA8]
MANFDLSYEKMLRLEFSNPSNALHYNPGEAGYTFMGIYEGVWKSWSGWDTIRQVLKKYSLKKASEICYNNPALRSMVKAFYKVNFWDKAKLDSVIPYEQAHLIFCFGVNGGLKKAVIMAQEIVGTNPDGIVGAKTLNTLNGFSPLEFEKAYKQAWVEYYHKLAKNNPARYAKFLQGWLNRVKNT